MSFSASCLKEIFCPKPVQLHSLDRSLEKMQASILLTESFIVFPPFAAKNLTCKTNWPYLVIFVDLKRVQNKTISILIHPVDRALNITEI